MRKLLRRLVYLVRRDRYARELDEEMAFHRAMTTGPAFGNATLAREDARAEWGWPILERIWHDVRHGVRVLNHHRIFAATSILSLALGVGAATTVFSVVEAELWRPLPFPEADRLVALFITAPGANASGQVSLPDLQDWRAGTRSFDDLAGFRWTERRILRGQGMPESLRVMPVTPGFFTALGRAPVLGRAFGPDEERGDAAVILTDACWRRYFGASPQVVGTTVTLDDVPYAVAGVTAPDARLEFVPDPDLFVNVDVRPAGPDRRGTRDLSVIGRLERGVDLPAARQDLQIVAQRLARAYPAVHQSLGTDIQPLRGAYTGSNWRPLLFMLGAAVFVLVLSCANVANLLLARALARQREFAIRRALGGGLGALVRQLTVEGLLLALPGAGLGLLLTAWAIRIIPLWLPPGYLDRQGSIGMNPRVYLVAIAIAAASAILFGIVPALFGASRDPGSALGQTGRTIAGSPVHRRVQRALILGEVVVTLVLLVGAGLFVNSFIRLTHVPLGFDPADRLTLRIPLGGVRYADAAATVRFAQAIVARAGAVPGVRMAAAATDVPLGSGPSTRFVIAGRPRPSAGDEPSSIARAVSPELFRVLGIRVLAGRGFSREDVIGAPLVATINERLARRFFAGENPVGQELVLVRSSAAWAANRTVRIVGVVSNVKDVGVNEVDFNDIYVPIAQAAVPSLLLVVSTAVPPAAVVDPLRRAVAAEDSHLPVSAITTMAERVDGSLRTARFHLLLVGAFGVFAIVLAWVGIYGVMSCAIEQRIPELAVRLALGASPAAVLGLALGDAMRMAVAGTAVGLVLSLALGRLLGSALYLVPGQHGGMLFGVSLADPLTLGCACASLVGVAAIAALIPARRAASVDPLIALRQS